MCPNTPTLLRYVEYPDEYARKVRERGRQFIQAIGREIPDNVLLTFFSFSGFPAEMNIADPDKRRTALETNRYGLYLPFLVGILDGLGPKMTVVDGNEQSYYYTDAGQFLASRKSMRETALNLIPAENKAVFLAQTQAAQALYPDLVFGEGPWIKKRAGLLSPEEQMKWVQIFWDDRRMHVVQHSNVLLFNDIYCVRILWS